MDDNKTKDLVDPEEPSVDQIEPDNRVKLGTAVTRPSLEKNLIQLTLGQ